MDYLLPIIAISFILFPLPYIFYKNGSNKFLFISSVVGASFITEILLFIIFIPLIVMFVFIMPSLRELNYDSNIVLLHPLADFIATHYFNLFSIFHVWLSILLYNKYELFRKHT